MMQLLRANTQRANAAAPRVAGAASAPFGNSANGKAVNDTTFTWNVMPVHTTAICTHGKRYERRLQEMLT